MPRGIPNKTDAHNEELETLPSNIADRTYSWVTFGKGQKGDSLFIDGAHNGVAWHYKRGVKLPVPDMIIKGCLEVAITEYLDQEDNVMRDSPSYPYTVHGPADISEVQAWLASSANQ